MKNAISFLRKSKVVYLLLLLCVSFTDLVGQQIAIPLINKYGDSNIYSSYYQSSKNKTPEKYKLTDTTKYKSWQVRDLTFETAQSLKERVLDGKLTPIGYSQYTTKYKIDTTYVIDRKLPRNKVAVLICIDEQKKKHIIVDANNNFDFKDDSTYIIDYTNSIKNYPTVNTTFDYFNGNEIADSHLQCIKLVLSKFRRA